MKDKKTTSSTNQRTYYEKIGIIFLFIGIIVWITYLIALVKSGHKVSLSSDPQIESNIGDFIGGVIGTLFSLVGVFLYYSALSLQRKELKETNEAFNVQVDLMKHELFESTLFNFLQSFDQIKSTFTKEPKGYREFTESINRIKTHYNWFSDYSSFDNIKNNLFIQPGNADYKFHAMFDQILLVQTGKGLRPNIDIKTAFNEVVAAINNADISDEKWKASMSYKLMFNAHHHNLSHYFRNLYSIFEYVDIQKGISEKQKYFEIIESKLSTHELMLLFYHALCFPNMKKMIHKYNLLKNLSIEDLLKSSHTDFYSEYKNENGTVLASINFKSRAMELQILP